MDSLYSSIYMRDYERNLLVVANVKVAGALRMAKAAVAYLVWKRIRL